eukprot:m.281390 g.281390  ORF g.281390 m.281390 type:complete len:84 (-) comp22890_c0_seq4:79-330(-)
MSTNPLPFPLPFLSLTQAPPKDPEDERYLQIAGEDEPDQQEPPTTTPAATAATVALYSDDEPLSGEKPVAVESVDVGASSSQE